MAEQNPDPAMLEVIRKMMESGASREDIDKFITKREDEGHPIRSFAAGAVSTLPYGLAAIPKSVYDVGTDLWDLGHGRGVPKSSHLLDAVLNLPHTIANSTPRELGEMAGYLPGTVATGKLLAAKGPGSVKAAAVGVGHGLEYVGEHPFPYLIGGGGIGAGIGALAHGNIEGALAGTAAGVVAGATPYVAGTMGKKLVRFAGGQTRADMKTAASEAKTAAAAKVKDMAQADADWQDAMAGRNLSFYDEQAANAAKATKATSDADKLTRIENAIREGGLEPGAPSIGQSISAPTPEGGRMNMGIRFKGKPVDTSGLPGAEASTEDLIRQAGMDPSKIISQGPVKKGPGVTPAVKLKDVPVSEPRLDELLNKFGGRGPDSPTVPSVGGLDVPGGLSTSPKIDAISQELLNRAKQVPVVNGGTKSSLSQGAREMSATPGYTVEDILSVGLNPKNPITKMTPELDAQIKLNRAQRNARYNTGETFPLTPEE